MLTLTFTKVLLIIGFGITLYAVCDFKKRKLFSNDNIFTMAMIFIASMLDTMFSYILINYDLSNFVYPNFGTMFMIIPLIAFAVLLFVNIKDDKTVEVF